VIRHFERAGLTVAANDPYKGGFITAHHGRPANRIHAIQIELRRDLYMNENDFVPVEPGFTKLRGTLDALVASLRALRL
jgi:N-formylglutamate amidohydrolase